MSSVKPKQRGKRKLPEGVVHIQCSFNNTIVSITDTAGNVVAWGSAGHHGFKGSRKGTPYAAQVTTEAEAKAVMEAVGMKRVAVNVSGPGAGRDSAIRSLRNAGLEVSTITDKTRLPHNGCRPRKKRRP